MTRKTKSPRRFPRIPTASDSGELTRLIWQIPAFSVQEIDNGTEFVHRLPFLIAEKIRRKRVGIFTMFFRSQDVNVGEELERAYRKTKYKGTAVNQLIDRALRSVLNEAMAEIFMKAKHSTDLHARYMLGGKEAFAKAARPRRLPDKNRKEQRAIRIARQYEKLFPMVVRIKLSINTYLEKGSGIKNEEKLCAYLKERFPQPWATFVISGAVLQMLPEIPGHQKSVDTLIGMAWTVRQLTVGIIKCLEDERKEGPFLSANTIMEDYLPLGRKLLKKLRSARQA
jgi:hypothetical protein